MKLEINITNGSGRNNYAALRGQSLARLLKASRPDNFFDVERLAAKNNLSRIDVGPWDAHSPSGIAARFYREDDRDGLVLTLTYDPNIRAVDIAEMVKLVLALGIARLVASAGGVTTMPAKVLAGGPMAAGLAALDAWILKNSETKLPERRGG